MYRVELKEASALQTSSAQRESLVPNVPCGVERLPKQDTSFVGTGVPNVPCGVES